MGVFNWAAPLIHRYGQRWNSEDARIVATWLGTGDGHGGEILDVGGGSGGLAVLLAEDTGATVTVLDPTPQLLKRIPDHERVRSVLGAAEAMPFEDRQFDAVVVTDAFHHFREQSAALRELGRVLKPGGGLLVLDSDPAWRGMWLLVLGEKLLGEPGAFLTPDQMCELAEAHGLAGECTPEVGANYRFVARKASSHEQEAGVA